MKLFLSVIITAMLFFSVVYAGNGKYEKKQDIKEIHQDKKDIGNSKATLEKLKQKIDIWHEANLCGNSRLCREKEIEIFDILKNDINTTQDRIERYRQKINRSGFESGKAHYSKIQKIDDRRDFRDDKSDLKTAQNLYKVKKRLYQSLHKTSSFSNKYRLLGDYVSIINREMGLKKLELAEDYQELHEP